MRGLVPQEREDAASDAGSVKARYAHKFGALNSVNSRSDSLAQPLPHDDSRTFICKGSVNDPRNGSNRYTQPLDNPKTQHLTISPFVFTRPVFLFAANFDRFRKWNWREHPRKVTKSRTEDEWRRNARPLRFPLTAAAAAAAVLIGFAGANRSFSRRSSNATCSQ